MNGQDESFGSREEKPRTGFVPLSVETRIRNENGRWIVYLNVPSWEPGDDHHPIKNDWKRINDYSTEQEANVAASWYEKSANRISNRRSGF